MILQEEQKDKDYKKEEDEPIDLDDPDLAKAATKIQATFRGHQARTNKPTNDDNTAAAEPQQ